MPAPRSVKDRLAELRHRREQLRAQEQALLARAASQARKDETRRRILLGSFLLSRLEQHPELRNLLRQELPAFLAAGRASEETRRRDMMLLAELLEDDAPCNRSDEGTRELAATPQAASSSDSGERHA